MYFVSANNTLVVNPYNPNSQAQRWQRKGHKIVNRYDNTVLDVAGSNTKPGARVCAWEWHGGKNQKWDFPTFKVCAHSADMGTGNLY